MSSEPARTIYLVSDGTCRTCERVVQAALVQFGPTNVQLVRKAHVQRPESLRELVQKAAQQRSAVFYTLVSDQSRQAIQEAAREHLVPVVDILGPVLVALYDLIEHAPRAQPGILQKAVQEQFDRIDAVEYTLAHDDGQRLNELDQADVVLVGVSRSGKSTTCFYLAYGGVRAANVPLFENSPPPPELRKLDPRRVIGLTVNPYRLQAVREARLRGWGMNLNDDYAHKLVIARELRAANEQMEQYGWRCIDASYKAVEEIAREVLRLLAESGIQLANRRPPEE